MNTAKEVIDFIESVQKVNSIKFGLINNSSRIYDISLLNKTEIPENTLALYIRKSRIDEVPNRFTLKDNELEVFLKSIYLIIQ